MVLIIWKCGNILVNLPQNRYISRIKSICQICIKKMYLVLQVLQKQYGYNTENGKSLQYLILLITLYVPYIITSCALPGLVMCR